MQGQHQLDHSKLTGFANAWEPAISAGSRRSAFRHAEVRRRPIGAVLVDICLDLGIVPGQMDRATGTNRVAPSSCTLAVSTLSGSSARAISPLSIPWLFRPT